MGAEVWAVSDEQPDLFGTPEAPSNPIEARFWKFHAANPHVYELFSRFTAEVVRKGYAHFSADMVMHRLRWETAITTTERQVIEGETLRLNNNHVAYYARLWMRDHPGNEGFFRTRRLPNGETSEAL